MRKNRLINDLISKRILMFTILLVGTFSLLVISGCDKKDSGGFTASFKYQYLDDNHVLFENDSDGEYYSMIWNFGNGVVDTTTNKNKSYNIYYPTAADYNVSLFLLDYTGNSKTVTQIISITSTDFQISFTADIDEVNPNYVNLTNTSQGVFDSFSWLYLDEVKENENEIQAYFPLKGSYEIELQVVKDNNSFSEFQTVIIEQDDPGNIPNLIWSDEFDYSGLPNSTYWNMETGGGGWGNNELQYYTNREDNALVANGVLTITAKEEAYGGRDYTSARITTQNKFDFKYGKIEARIKLPYGKGIWPAFWMLGDNISSVGWPACGEIDIMEMVGGDNNGDNTVYSTLHWQHDGGHADYGESYKLPSGVFADDFHVFAVEWDAQEIRGYVDDIHYFTADIVPSQLSEFHNDFFIILNMAVGGAWPGWPNANTSFPQTMQIDYVRVYSL